MALAMMVPIACSTRRTPGPDGGPLRVAGATWGLWVASPVAPPEPAPAYVPDHLPGSGSACVAWRQTAQCSATGRREPDNDRACEDMLSAGWSGYCECGGGRFVGADCGHPANNCLTVCSKASWSAPMMVPSPSAPSACVAWRQTGGCRASGRRETSNDKACDARIESGWSGFCDCAGGERIGVDCGHPPSTCASACGAGAWPAAH
jgi:hypothetical protein